MKIRKLYADYPYQIRLKAPMLGVTLLALIVVLSLSLANSLSQRNIMDGGIIGIMFLMLGFSGFQLLRGKYNLAADMLTYSLVYLIILLNQLSPIKAEHDVATNVILGIASLLLSTLFSSRRKHLYIHTASVITDAVIVIFKAYLGGHFTQQTATIQQQITTPLIMLGISVVLVILLRSVFDRVVTDALGQMEESRRQAEYMEDLVASSATQLEEARGMESQTTETASSVLEIDRNIESISDQAEHLKKAYRESRSALEEISGKLTVLDRISEDQSANITETGAALEEMVASIRNVTGIIQAKQARVQDLKDRADDGARVIGKTSTSFEQVSKQIESIEGVISIITEISNQTNLLAMNAAIEAAHAGDQGKGFAVVAGEVRKLAGSSAENAARIGSSLAQLITAIEEMGHHVKESGTTFGDISREVDQVNEAMSEIAMSIQELASGSNQILVATNRLTDLTTQVVDSVKEVKSNEVSVSRQVEGMGNFVEILSLGLQEISQGTTAIRDAMNSLTEVAARMNSYSRELHGKMQG